MTERFGAISFVASDTPEAQAALDKLVERYGNADPAAADVVVALGGDGLMLQTLHRFLGTGKPIYGMNRGSVGFLMNEFKERGLTKRLDAAQRSIVHPLSMQAIDRNGATVQAKAITPRIVGPAPRLGRDRSRRNASRSTNGAPSRLSRRWL